MSQRVQTGLQRVFEEHDLCQALAQRRVAWLVNATSVDQNLEHAIDRSLAMGWNIRKIFGPEHGLRGTAQDMIGVDTDFDPLTGLRVISLYGHDIESLEPDPATLEGVDVVLIDMQDIGTRYYTYACTAAMMISACAKAGVEAWVLDRPNPLGGEVIEGGLVRPEMRSFVGMFSIPTRHAMTLGEQMSLLAARHGWSDALRVIKMKGWRREMTFAETGVPWVMPSPNMPTVEVAVVYPGQCFLEGTELSEGRGTTRPFEIFGAPWLSPNDVLEALVPQHMEGCKLRPLAFEPTFQKHAGTPCMGFQMHVTDFRRFRSLSASMELLRAIRKVHPEAFGWRRDAYEFVSDRLAIDLLLGDMTLRLALEDDTPVSELLFAMESSRKPFEEERRAHLLYL